MPARTPPGTGTGHWFVEPNRPEVYAAAVAAAFPLAGGEDGGGGVLLGVDLTGGLVDLPLAGGANRNLVVLGPSGGDKSYAVKSSLQQALMALS